MCVIFNVDTNNCLQFLLKLRKFINFSLKCSNQHLWLKNNFCIKYFTPLLEDAAKQLNQSQLSKESIQVCYSMCDTIHEIQYKSYCNYCFQWTFSRHFAIKIKLCKKNKVYCTTSFSNSTVKCVSGGWLMNKIRRNSEFRWMMCLKVNQAKLFPFLSS